MDAEQNLELARKVYPNDENLRVAYMLGLLKCCEVAREELIDKACRYLQDHFDKDLEIYLNNAWRKRDEFIEMFKKYMEE